MAGFCNALELNTNIKIIVLRNFNESLIVNKAISIFGNLANLMIRRFKSTMLQNPEKKLHDLSDNFLPIKEILETPNTKILFLCVDISSESIDFIKFCYPENELINYKIVTEKTCLEEYPDIFTKIITPDIHYETYNSHHSTQLFDDNISCILPNQLYLTGDFGSRNINQINALGITNIINVSDTLENYFAENSKFKYLKIPIPDSPKIIITNYFPIAFEFIDTAITNGEKVMIHCFAGKSRSASIIIGYLMKTQKIKFEDALKIVAKSRPCVEPNIGFLQQLLQYETTF